jgi:hypothetical protein
MQQDCEGEEDEEEQYSSYLPGKLRDESSIGPSYVDTSDCCNTRHMLPKMKHMQGSGSMNTLHQDRDLNSKRQSTKPLSITESKQQTHRD